MPRTAVPNPEQVPADSKPTLDGFTQNIGLTPNMLATFALSRIAFNSWATLRGSLSKALDLKTRESTRLAASEVKQAEAKTLESERRYREVQQTDLEHANRVATMGQLTASIAHEVNQPIAAAVINAQAALRWLGAQPPDLEEVRRSLSRIVQNANRAGDVVGRIRALIKKAPPRKDWVDINELIREVVELTRSETLKNGTSAQTSLLEGLPLIEGDRVQLQQVVLNLVINAVEAMGAVAEGPRELFITTAQAEPSGVLVAVKDSGPGLAPGSLQHLFAPFYTTKPDGLGMGLSICRSIIESHAGRLWVAANLPRGAIFQFTLPTTGR
jgi:C4-dicarboxylate-specific signal transduction histidine kinase